MVVGCGALLPKAAKLHNLQPQDAQAAKLHNLQPQDAAGIEEARIVTSPVIAYVLEREKSKPGTRLFFIIL